MSCLCPDLLDHLTTPRPVMRNVIFAADSCHALTGKSKDLLTAPESFSCWWVMMGIEAKSRHSPTLPVVIIVVNRRHFANR